MQVLIGYDGSDAARDAIHELHRAGLPRDTQARLVSIADVLPHLATESLDPAVVASGWQNAPFVRKARALAEAAVAQAGASAAEGAALLKAQFPEWTVAHASYAGSPSETLIQFSDRVADLIVVGSQGRSALGRLVLGSVSQKVLMHARCSVRVSRRPPTGAPPRGGAVRIIVGIDGSRHSALAVSAVAARVWPAGTEVKVMTAVDLNLLSVLAGPAPFRWSAPWMNATPREEAADWAYEAVEAVAAELRAAGLTAIPVVEEANP
jgi:nucleotide-binding universal stress UspA family protein